MLINFQLYPPVLPKVTNLEEVVEEHTLNVNGGSETILFADDESEIRSMGKLFLEHLGYKVLLAANGEEAVSLYAEHKNNISAVVADMTMPEMTGHQAFQKILEINSQAKILLCSGYTSEEYPNDSLKQGVVILYKSSTLLSH